MPGGEKTESATPRKRQEVREKGQVARSAEISTVAGLLVGMLFVRNFGPGVCTQLSDVMTYSFSHLPTSDFVVGTLQSRGLSLTLMILSMIGPLLLGSMVVGVAVNAAQVGFLFSFNALMPDVTRLNPLSGLGRMFSGRSLFELAKAMGKVGLSGYYGYSMIRDRYEALLTTPGMELRQSIQEVVSLGADMAFNMTIVMLCLAIADYGYQRWQFEQSIKMTREELKEEMKQSEGNPQLKGRIRQQQRAMAMRRMMQAVPKADVVVTNPTHYAVALQYQSATMRAPVVIAKGERLVAQRIKEIAREHGVPIVEDKPLAQALFHNVEIGQDISPELYKAVAEVLAFVYKMKRRGVSGVLARPVAAGG
jgi:flagellar biosynthesis protein FlhB